MKSVRYQLGHGGAIYVIATAMIVTGTIYTQANLLFWASGLMAGALVASLIVPIVTMRRLQIERLGTPQGVVGQPLVLRYAITNRSWVPMFGLLIREGSASGQSPFRRRLMPWRRRSEGEPVQRFLPGVPIGWVMHLGPRQSIQAESMTWPRQRGAMQLKTITVSSSFPFGIISKTVRVSQEQNVLILPRLYRIHRRTIYLASDANPTGRRTIERPGGREEFYGVREYRSGDSFKSIDWKQTSKTSTLVTRELTLPSSPRLMLTLDLRRPPEALEETASRRKRDNARASAAGNDADQDALPIDDDPRERAICLAASVLCDAHLRGCEIGLTVRGTQCQSFRLHHSLPHRKNILDALARIDLEAPADDGQVVATRGMEPTVVVRVDGQSANSRTIAGRTILQADQIRSYIKEIDDDTDSLLAGAGAARRVAGSRRRRPDKH